MALLSERPESRPRHSVKNSAWKPTEPDGGAHRTGPEPPRMMIPGKTIHGILQGGSVPDAFLPQLIELHMQGRFPYDRLVKFYTLDQINQAAEDGEKGGTIKPVIRV
jgi:Zn-dependent alcohol dehydrogenase